MTRSRIWVINLDRAPERLQRVALQLARVGLGWERLPAVDARLLTPEQFAALDAGAYRRRHGKEPVAGELACYLSHVEVMRRLLASDAEVGVVLEDDVIVREGLPAVLDGLVAQPGRWDVAKLSRVHSGTPVPVGEVAAGHRLAVMLTRCTGSSAYVVNRRAAGAYLRGLLPMALPYDHVFDQGWRFGLKVRLVVPAPCTHDEAAASTILGPEGSRKFHWTRRLPAYAYRWRTESRRFVRGLSEVVREVTA